MNSQLSMFEPEGSKLSELVAVYIRNANFEVKRSDSLHLCGYTAAALMCGKAASDAFELASVAEMALQFENLAGLV